MNLHYIASLPNPGREGNAKFLRGGDPSLVARWVKAENRPGFGIYYLPNPLKLDATVHGKENIAAIEFIYCDVDFKDVLETADEATQRLANLLLRPTTMVDSGHGRHVLWQLKEAIACDDPEFERACALQAALIEYLGADPQVRPWSLLRLPGTLNSKQDPHVPCEVAASGPVVDISELREMAELVEGMTLLTRKPKATNGHARAAGGPHMAGAERGPVDVEAELASMCDGATTNAAHTRVVPSLLRKGEHPDDVLKLVVDETMERVGARLNWSRDVEVRVVISRILAGYNNVLLKTHDHTTGAIPEWLPGEFHQRWAAALEEGGRPSFRYNRHGFYLRANGPRGAAGADSPRTEDGHEPQEPSSSDKGSPAGKPARAAFVLRPFVPFDLAALPPRQWLYGRHYQRRTVSATIAPGGWGKTTLCMVEAVAVATCRNLLEEQPEARLRAWYHNGEDNIQELNRRLGAICLHYGIPQEELSGWFFMTSGNEVPLRVAKGYSELKIDAPLIKCIEGEIARNEIDIAILDPLVTLHGVPEQDNSKMDTVVRIFASIADAQDCAIELAHHTRKLAPGTTDYTVDDMRGASAIKDAVRAARMLNQMREKDATDVGIPEHERTAYFRVDRVKGNNSPPRQAVWRRFVNVELPNTDEVGVVVPWLFPGQDSPSAAMTAAAQTADHVFMQLLVRLTLEGRTVSDRAGANYAPHVLSQETEAKVAKLGKKPLADAMRRLFKDKRIRAESSGEKGHRVHRLVVI